MARVTVNLDDETILAMRAAAEADGGSLSAWLARLVRDRMGRAWTAGPGAGAATWADFPSADAIRAT
jgi:hypothetical protein